MRPSLDEEGPRPAILMADDDPADVMLTRKAAQAAGIKAHFFAVDDGDSLLDFLRGAGNYTDRRIYPRPDLILLDLNMPRLDGHSVLQALKSDRDFKRIPVVVLSTSREQQDIVRSYDNGANTYIPKPKSFEELILAWRTLDTYWFDIASTPVH